MANGSHDGGGHSSCSRRRGYRLGAVATPAALLFFGALHGASADHEQLLEPVLWHNESFYSIAHGLAYNTRSGILYEVGERGSDIVTGDVMPNYDFYMRGYDVSSQSETFFMIDGNYDELDVWKAVAVDEDNGLAFGVGQAYSDEHSITGVLHARAIDEGGGTVWEYEDQGRLPSEDYAYQTEERSTFNAAECDETRGLLLLAGEAAGCLGLGCTLEFDNTENLFVAVALNASTGDFVWDRRVVTGVEQEGAAYGLALDVEGGVAFVGGHDTNSGGTDDLLIVALEEDTGEVIWKWQHGTLYEDNVYDLAYDDQNGVLYACGYTTGSFSESLTEEKYADAIVFALNVSMMATLGATYSVDEGGPALIWLKSFASGPLMDRTEYAYAITYDRNGVVHVSGTTQGKGFGDDGFEDITIPSTKLRLLRFVHMTFSLNATDGETLISYQSPIYEASLFADSVMVPDTAQGDLYMAGFAGDLDAAMVYSRTRPTSSPTPAPSPAPTTAPTTAAPVTPAPTPSPTLAPTVAPSRAPSPAPTTPAPTTPPPVTPAPTTPVPTPSPTPAPTTPGPTRSPSPAPTTAPSRAPSPAPTTPAPTTPAPTLSPSPAPTMAPSVAPSLAPSPAPTTPAPTTAVPTTPAPVVPTFPPTPAPTPAPTTLPPTPAPSTIAPTNAPTPPEPTPMPTPGPTEHPTRAPTITTAPADVTFPPTTAPVMTPSPTTVTLSTEAPLTEAPFTEAPISEAPSTEAPSPGDLTPSPTRKANQAGIDTDDSYGNDEDSGDGLSSEQEILVMFGVVFAGGILAGTLMLGFFLGKRGFHGGGGGGGADDDDSGHGPTSVDGREV